MAAETATRQAPRRSLLIALAVVGVAALAYVMWPTAVPPQPQSNQQRTPQKGAAQGSTVTPAALDVHLDALKTPPPAPSGSDRNPFRFQPKPPPPPPAPVSHPGTPGSVGAARPGPPPGPPPLPPIPLKFIGILEGQGPGKVAIFSDSKGTPIYGREGDIILGQYRLVRIGVESVVMEYVDGRGRQTIPLRGQ